MVLAFAKLGGKMMVGRCQPIISHWISHLKCSAIKMVIALAKLVVPLWTRKPRWANLQIKYMTKKEKYKWLLNYKLTFIVLVRWLQKYGLSSDQVELLAIQRQLLYHQRSWRGFAAPTSPSISLFCWASFSPLCRRFAVQKIVKSGSDLA